MKIGPLQVQRIAAEPFALGTPEVALAKLRRRLYVAPGSSADARLQSAMDSLLEDRDGVLSVKGVPTVDLGLVRWGADL